MKMCVIKESMTHIFILMLFNSLLRLKHLEFLLILMAVPDLALETVDRQVVRVFHLVRLEYYFLLHYLLLAH